MTFINIPNFLPVRSEDSYSNAYIRFVFKGAEKHAQEFREKISAVKKTVSPPRNHH